MSIVQLWNHLPAALRNIPSYIVFKKRLKTFLFLSCYRLLSIIMVSLQLYLNYPDFISAFYATLLYNALEFSFLR